MSHDRALPPGERLDAGDRGPENRVHELEAANAELTSLLAGTGIAALLIDDDLRLRRFTPAAATLLGLAGGVVGQPIDGLALEELDPDLSQDVRAVLRDLGDRESEVSQGDRHFLRRASLHRSPDGRVGGVMVTFHDATSSRRTTERIAAREAQQAAVASLGHFALATSDLHTILHRAAEVVATTLDDDFVKVLELLPDGDTLALRAGVGWKPGLVGRATVGGGDSQAGYTLRSGAPVVVEDIASEARFRGPALLTEHGVVSGMSTIIGHPENPWGVIGTHSSRSVRYTVDDVNFLDAVAHVLAEAIGRVRREALLQQSRQRLQRQYTELKTIYHRVPIGLAVYDRDLRVARLNALMADIIGVPLEASLQRRLSELNAVLAPTIEPILRQVRDHGHAVENVMVSGETRVSGPGLRHWLTSCHPIGDSGGVDGVIVVMRDITERHRYEQRLEAENRVAQVLSRATDVTTAIPDVLEAVARAFGFDVGEYWVQDPADGMLRCQAFRTPDHPEHSEEWGTVLASIRCAPGEGLIGRAWELGQPVWLHDRERDPTFVRRQTATALDLRSGFALPIGGEQGVEAVLSFFVREEIASSVALTDTVATIARSVNEFVRRTRAERALRAREDRLRAIVDGAPIPMFLHSADGTVLFLNDAFTAATGYTIEDVATTRDWCRRVRRLAGERDHALAPAGVERVRETAVWTRDGERRRWALFTSLVPDHTVDASDYSVTLAVDITARHETERAREEAKRAAEEANRAKTAFLAAISHEIRTPMTAILGFADLLEGHVSDPEHLEYAQTIQRNGRYLIDLLNDVLDVARIEAGRLDLESRAVCPRDLIDDVASLWRIRSEERGIPIRVDVAEDVPELIRTDPTRLRQVLINLVSNAVKFTDQGEVWIRARRLPGDPDRLGIEVNDTGIGIDPGVRETMFEAFGQVSSDRRRAGGVGLGLSICRSLAAALGWELTVDSRVGEGSSFCIRIPLVEGDVPPEPTQPVRRSATRHRLQGRILVVEDHADLRRLLTHRLRAAGAEPHAVRTGEEAIAALRSESFVAVLVDVELPGIDGYETTRRIRQLGYLAPIVAVTASVVGTAGWREAGCDAQLGKPVTQQEFVDTLATLIDRPDRSTAAPAHRALRILLVEDHGDSRRALAKLLSADGRREVRAAASAEQALHFVSDWSPDVCLLDLELPGTDGIELSTMLRTAGCRARMIAVTGRGASADIARAAAAGFDHHLLKPVDVQALLDLIDGG